LCKLKKKLDFRSREKNVFKNPKTQYLANIKVGGLYVLVYCKQNCLTGKFFLFINILLYNWIHYWERKNVWLLEKLIRFIIYTYIYYIGIYVICTYIEYIEFISIINLSDWQLVNFYFRILLPVVQRCNNFRLTKCAESNSQVSAYKIIYILYLCDWVSGLHANLLKSGLYNIWKKINNVSDTRNMTGKYILSYFI